MFRRLFSGLLVAVIISGIFAWAAAAEARAPRMGDARTALPPMAFAPAVGFLDGKAAPGRCRNRCARAAVHQALDRLAMQAVNGATALPEEGPVVRLASAANRPPYPPVILRSRTMPPRRPPTALPPRTRLPASRLRKPPAQNESRISPTEALQLAMRRAPGSMGLGVRLLPGPRPVYAVKLKVGNRVVRVLVDAVTGRIIGR